MRRCKVCMLGAYATGKTSLVRRFVHSIFSDKYQTSIGVKVSRKEVEVEAASVLLMLWDLAGEDEFQKVRNSYLRGSSGLFLVVDGTRRDTLDQARSIRDNAIQTIGDVPVVVAINKVDLRADWGLSADDFHGLDNEGWQVFLTSAKDGSQVDEAFRWLAGATTNSQ